MRLPEIRHRGSMEFNMTPMIDVVFLLIIFFLMSSHLAQQENQLELNLPSASSGRRAGDDVTRRVTFNVLGDGTILVGGGAVAREALRPLLEYETRSAEQELQVRIRCDRAVPYRFVEPIMLACVQSGVWNVTFAVVRPDGG